MAEEKGFILDKSTNNEFERGKNHLLIIGIDQYQHNIANLSNAVRDAKAVRDVLVRKYQFEKDQLEELYDEQASQRGIAKALKGYTQKKKIGSSDSLLIYFSGHGHYDRTLKEAYWVPSDAQYEAETDYIDYSFLIKVLKVIPARHVLIIADSCYSGAVLVNERDLATDRLERDPSRWLIASGRNEVVPDGEDGGHSPFAENLIEQLSCSSNDTLTTGTLVNKLTRNVSYNSPQTPIGRKIYGVGDKGGEFIFHLKRDEEGDWKIAKQIGDQQGYRQYLANYPDGKYTISAQEKLERLEDETAWIKAQKENSIKAYKQYCDEFPKGKFTKNALGHIEVLKENIDWDKARLQNQISSYENFLQAYPNGKFSIEATKQIIIIKEETDWKLTKQQNTKTAYYKFNEKYPDGKYTRKAINAIRYLEEEVLWKKCIRNNNLSDYLDYQKQYPIGKYSKEVKIKINILISEEEKVELTKEIEAQWEKVKNKNEIYEYEKFIQEYPKNKYIQDVEKLLENLRQKKKEEDAWERAKVENTIAAYREYLSKFKDGKFSKQAERLIEQLKEPKRKKIRIQDKPTSPPQSPSFSSQHRWPLLIIKTIATISITYAIFLVIDYCMRYSGPIEYIQDMKVISGPSGEAAIEIRTGENKFLLDLENVELVHTTDIVQLIRTPFLNIVTNLKVWERKSSGEYVFIREFSPHYGIYNIFFFSIILLALTSLGNLIIKKKNIRIKVVLGLLNAFLLILSFYFVSHS